MCLFVCVCVCLYWCMSVFCACQCLWCYIMRSSNVVHDWQVKSLQTQGLSPSMAHFLSMLFWVGLSYVSVSIAPNLRRVIDCIAFRHHLYTFLSLYTYSGKHTHSHTHQALVTYRHPITSLLSSDSTQNKKMTSPSSSINKIEHPCLTQFNGRVK
jgi:hypothetical protein